MSHPFGQADLVNQQLITVAQVDHLPIVAQFARRIGLVETINRLVPTQMEVQPGLIVLGMVLDTLSGRSPLYHLEGAFETMDRELLFGEPLPASYFNDDNAGGVLDDVFQANTQIVFAELSRLAAAVFALSHHHVHFDTTSISLYGEYRGADPDKETVHITHGYSKDKRPDLKQVVLSLLCIEGNIPIIGSMEDGNASDKTINHQVLNDVAKHMRTHGVEEEAFIYIADSAMVSEPNLAQAGLFITRLPATYNEHERVIMEAVEEDDQWYTIGRIAHTKPTKNRPGAEYRVQDRSVTLYGQSYRAIVVHSSAHDQRRQKRLDRDIQHSLKEAKALAKAAEKRLYLCRPDAEEAAIELLARRRTYHRFEVTVDALPKYARGRPKNGQEKQPVRFEYRLRVRITENEQAIAQGRLVAGCFVMLTNVPDQDDPKGYSAEQVLRTYKEQHGIERNFGFLKDDQIVNALFLERPERIEALGLVLLISLLIWRLLEHVMRQSLKMNDDTVPGWDNKPTDRPTAYMLTWKFKGIMVLSIDGERMLARPLNDTQQAFLNALHLTETCFTQVPGSG